MKKWIVLAALLVFSAGTAVQAAEWNFYGSARVNSFYTDWKTDMLRGAGANPLLGTGGDTKNYEEGLYGNSRIGAKITVSDTLAGRFEYGALGGSANVRILWGEWHFGAGSLGVGKHYTPLLMPYSNQVYSIHALNKGDHDMSTFGMLYGDRKAQIQFKLGGFKIAAVEPRIRVSDATFSASQPATEIKLPNIQAKYKRDFDFGHIAVAGGFQTFDIISGSREFTVRSYVLGLGGRVNAGKAYFKANIWGGQNVGNLVGILVNGQLWSTLGNAGTATFDGAGMGYAQWNPSTETLVDNDALAGLLVAGYEIRKGLYLEAGYGYTRTELDTDTATKDDSETYYLQATVFLAPGVFITPEIGRINMKQAGQFDAKYFGIKWQINF